MNQRRFLTGLTHEPASVKALSSQSLPPYGLRSASNAQRVAGALLEKDIVDRENGSFVIVDRFLRLGVQQTVE